MFFPHTKTFPRPAAHSHSTLSRNTLRRPAYIFLAVQCMQNQSHDFVLRSHCWDPFSVHMMICDHPTETHTPDWRCIERRHSVFSFPWDIVEVRCFTLRLIAGRSGLTSRMTCTVQAFVEVLAGRLISGCLGECAC